MDGSRQVATVSFVFTDLVGSTRLRERVGDDRADELMRKHLRRLRDVVGAHGGRVVKYLGDGVMAAFSSASDAVGAAIDMQRAATKQGDEDAVELRVGVHMGEVIVEGGDYLGTPVVVAKRLCDVANGGQILTSDVVADVVGSRGNFSFNKLGTSTLRGLSGRFELSDIAWRDTGGPAAGISDRRSRLRRRVWLAAAVAGLVIAAVLVVLARDPKQRIAPGGPTWQRVDAPALEGTAEHRVVTRMAVGSGRLVLTGYERRAGLRRGLIWVSEDGRDWEEVDLPARPAGPSDSPLWGVVAGPRGFVAVGSSGAIGERRALVYASQDGRLWDRARDPGGVLDGPGDQVVNRVIPGGPGYVAVGYERTTDSDGAIWTSPDGLTWRRVAGPKSVFGGAGNQEIRGIYDAPGGKLVAVGLDDSSGDRDPAAWIWDGNSWTRADPGSSLYGHAGEQVMTSVVSDDRRVVAVGYDVVDGMNVAAVWVTEDLENWRRLSASDLTVDVRPGVFQGITHIGGRFYGVGTTTEDGSDATVWVSEDGTRWAPFASNEALTGEGDQTMRDLVRFEDRFVAAGWEDAAGGSRPLVWIGRP